MLYYILKQCGDKMGLNPKDSSQREVLLRFVNEACRELYVQSDPPGSLMEQTFKVNGDQTITLPNNVGHVRGVREAASMQAWHVNQLRPRYNQFNWKDMWKNYRLKDKQALQATVTNQSVGVLSVLRIESPAVVVSLTGPIQGATSISETVVMDATSKNTVNPFTDYTSVSKDRVNVYDVALSDVDGKLLTTIPNNELYAEYQVIDVSSCPWLSQNTSPLDNYVEILFKKKLTYMFNDNDAFPAYNDFDDVIVNKVLQLWSEEQGKSDSALGYDAKATRTLARLNEEYNRDTEEDISLSAHPHDSMLRRVGSGLRRRFSLYGRRRY